MRKEPLRTVGVTPLRGAHASDDDDHDDSDDDDNDHDNLTVRAVITTMTAIFKLWARTMMIMTPSILPVTIRCAGGNEGGGGRAPHL